MNDHTQIHTQQNATANRSFHFAGATFASTAVIAIALSVAGCKHTATPAPVDDASLTQAVQAKIASESSLASEPIQASVQQGVATLTGNASSDAARSLAANDAAQVSGIRTVVNNLTVTAAPLPPPQTAAISQSAQPIPAQNHPEPKPTRKPKPSPVSQRSEPAPTPAATNEAVATPPAPIERATPKQSAPVPAAPEVRSVTLPADTTIPIRMSQTLDSATTQEGDTFSAVLDSDILIDGRVVLRQGTPVSGRVDTVQEAAHFKGSSLLIIQLTSIQARGNRLLISTDAYSKAGQGRGKNSAEKIGGGAAVGAILGGILGGGKGAAIGAGVGGGAGAGAQAITRGQQVQIPAESLVRFKLTSPVTVRLSGSSEPGGEAELQRHN